MLMASAARRQLSTEIKVVASLIRPSHCPGEIGPIEGQTARYWSDADAQVRRVMERVDRQMVDVTPEPAPLPLDHKRQ
jgi:hypothetical protein